jgi:hypothetical protein
MSSPISRTAFVGLAPNRISDKRPWEVMGWPPKGIPDVHSFVEHEFRIP